MIKRRVLGYSIDYSTVVLDLPDTPLTPQKRIQMAKELRKVSQAKRRCERQSNPDFEKMFEKP